jgi:hypothetical protein
LAVFLFGTIYAGLGILAWLPMFNGELELWTDFSPIDWHVHEMLYGYLPAVVTGFLCSPRFQIGADDCLSKALHCWFLSPFGRWVASPLCFPARSAGC